jgi:transcriptional regulator with XRE-family HTH domain
VTLEERVRFALARSGLSARKLSEKAELSEGFLAYVFRTLRRDPTGAPFSVGNLRALARAAGVSSRWLIDGTGSPDDPEADEQPAPSIDAHFVARPVFGSLPEWPEMLARAQEIAPQIPPWIWERMANMSPVLSAPPTPVMIAELAIWMHRHERVSREIAPKTGAHRT